MIRRPTPSIRRAAAVPRLLVALAAALLTLTWLTGCQSTASAPAAPAASADYAAVIDVRTPAEFGDGHVEGAQNIDVNASGFDEAIAALPDSGTYLVYCRSGNRSAQAADRMRQAGLEVVDGGGLDDMRDAGYPFTS